MSKEEKSLIPIKKENVILRIFKFIKNIFIKKKDIGSAIENEKEIQNDSNKKEFIKNISFKEDEETNQLIEMVKKDKSILYGMSREELMNFNEALKEKQKFLDKKIEILKTNIKMQNNGNTSFN